MLPWPCGLPSSTSSIGFGASPPRRPCASASAAWPAPSTRSIAAVTRQQMRAKASPPVPPVIRISGSPRLHRLFDRLQELVEIGVLVERQRILFAHRVLVAALQYRDQCGFARNVRDLFADRRQVAGVGD